MNRRILDRTLPTLAENLALDEALLLEAEAGRGGEALRFWEWPAHAAVLGVSGRLSQEVDRDACHRDGIEFRRRASGGGTVLLGSGCLLYSLVLNMTQEPALRDIHGSYRHILGKLIHALAGIAPVSREGISDLAVAGMKVAGSAQQRKQSFLLHHGVILFGFDIAAMSRYLPLPSRQPDYRAGRSHEAFVVNLDCDANRLKALIRGEWPGTDQFDPLPAESMARLIAEKYGAREWIERR